MPSPPVVEQETTPHIVTDKGTVAMVELVGGRGADRRQFAQEQPGEVLVAMAAFGREIRSWRKRRPCGRDFRRYTLSADGLNNGGLSA